MSRIIRLMILPIFLIFALSLSAAPILAEGDDFDDFIDIIDADDLDLTCAQLLSAPISSFAGRNYFFFDIDELLLDELPFDDMPFDETMYNGDDSGFDDEEIDLIVQLFVFTIDLQAGQRLIFQFNGTGIVASFMLPVEFDVDLDDLEPGDLEMILFESIAFIENETIFFTLPANSTGEYGVLAGALGDVSIAVIDCGFPPVGGCPSGFPILGQIMVTGDLEGYGQPGQDRISGLNVFNDASGDGFDTFDILDIVNDEDGNPAWYGIFLGGCDPVYVDANLVTRIR